MRQSLIKIRILCDFCEKEILEESTKRIEVLNPNEGGILYIRNKEEIVFGRDYCDAKCFIADIKKKFGVEE